MGASEEQRVKDVFLPKCPRDVCSGLRSPWITLKTQKLEMWCGVKNHIHWMPHERRHGFGGSSLTVILSEEGGVESPPRITPSSSEEGGARSPPTITSQCNTSFLFLLVCLF